MPRAVICSALAMAIPDGYRIPKDRLTLSIRLVDGDVLHGDMFVQHVEYAIARSEFPADVLNAHEPYFPIRTEEGEVVLVAKSRVAEVWGDGIDGVDEMRVVSARRASLEVHLTGGVVHCGSVLLEVPTDRPRLLDFLNDYRERFLTLYTVEGVHLLNTAYIQRVCPLD